MKIKKFLSVITAAAVIAPSFLMKVSSENTADKKPLVSCLVSLEGAPIACIPEAREMGVRDFILTDNGKAAYDDISGEHEKARENIASLLKIPASGLAVTYDYTAACNGFVLLLTAEQYSLLKNNTGSLGIKAVTVIDHITEADAARHISLQSRSETVYDKTRLPDIGHNGEGTVIAVIDSSFDLYHEFFALPDGTGHRLSSYDIEAAAFCLSSGIYYDHTVYFSEKIPFAFDYENHTPLPEPVPDSHGTHVAGTAAGCGNGAEPVSTAPGAQLLLMACGNGLNESCTLAAYDDALYLGADVINASYGTAGLSKPCGYPEAEAVENIVNTGTIFCTAAGNEGKFSDTTNTDYSMGGSFGNVTGTLAVGSAAKAGNKIRMSGFSSWAFTEDLIIKPDVTGIGENVLSSVYNGNDLHNEYGRLSGTSMSAAELSGMCAVLAGHIKRNKEKYGVKNAGDIAETAARLIMSTAVPVYTNDGAAIASPRLQGNGLADTYAALSTPCFISSHSESDNFRPKISLGDGFRQELSFGFGVSNIGESDAAYSFDSVLMMDEFKNGKLSENPVSLKKAADYSVSYYDKTGKKITEISVKPSETSEITVKIKLSDKIYSNAVNANGLFTDGFIRLLCGDAPDLTLSFSAFCGDWSYVPEGGPMTAFGYESSASIQGLLKSSILCDQRGKTAGVNIIDMAVSRPCFSPDGDGRLDTLAAAVFFGRRCYNVTAEITNEKGQTVYTEKLSGGNNIIDGQGNTAWNSMAINWNFKENGKVRNNAVYTLTISASSPLSDAVYSISQEFMTDTEKPAVKSTGLITSGNNEYYIIECSDNGTLCGAYDADKSGNVRYSSFNRSVSGKYVIIQKAKDSETGVFDTAMNTSYITPADVSYKLELKCGRKVFATSDESSFSFSGALTGSDSTDADITLEIDETPERVYKYGKSKVPVCADGFIIGEIEAEVGIRGDANGDKKFSVRDAAYTAKLIADKNTDSIKDTLAGYCADHDKNGIINVRDAASMARALSLSKSRI